MHILSSKTYNARAKVGYIYRVTDDGALDTARQWMLDDGCVQVVKELPEHEHLRPQWKQLLTTLERSDELVMQKREPRCARLACAWRRS